VARLAALLVALLFAAAPAWGGGALSVVTTTTDLKALVEAVGDDRVRVESLTPAVHDPHAVEVKPGQLARLREAALLVRIGLDHEPWLARAVQTAGNPALVRGAVGDLDASAGIPLLDAETVRARPARGGHVHGLGNTHYWLDPENARVITASILGGLARVAPADQAVFTANRARFLMRLDAGLARWIRAAAPLRGLRVVVAHDSWPYFARRFGLLVVAAIEPSPGVPPSPQSLGALTTHMREGGVRLVIAEPWSNPSVVSQVAERGGARVVALPTSVGADPEATDYLSLFDVDIRRLVEAAAATAPR
jgi:ABC-type Zn uptake system ZnuABC Zn-binding protein ZnuA